MCYGAIKMIYMENPKSQRFYLLYIEQDIFNTWCLIKSFGSLLNRRGRTLPTVCSSQEQAWNELTEVEYAKRQRGYVYADLDSTKLFHLRPQNLFEIKPSKTQVQKLKNPQAATLNVTNPDQLEFNFMQEA